MPTPTGHGSAKARSSVIGLSSQPLSPSQRRSEISLSSVNRISRGFKPGDPCHEWMDASVRESGVAGRPIDSVRALADIDDALLLAHLHRRLVASLCLVLCRA